MHIKKTYLFVIAGLLWVFAGGMVLSLGLKSLYAYHPIWIYPLALVIYLIFYLKVFSKLVKKHEKRIMNDEASRLAVWMFFDKKSYIIMVIMMSMGIMLRKLNILPVSFISYFYTGLGLALLSCGLRFVYLYFKHKDEGGKKHAARGV